MQENRLLSTGDNVILGLSGGADSVCLFFVLLALQKEYDLGLTCVHVNHGIRATADRDEAFVKDLAQRHGVEIQVFREDIPKLAKKKGLSLEEAGRMYRYEAFEAVRTSLLEKSRDTSNQHRVWIALAHHLDDQAETVLYRLMRGTGLKGLGAMAPQRDQYIRPLLEVDKAEILAYLSEIQQEYVEDETNADTDYDRNYIRHEVLPQLAEAFHDKVNLHLARTARMAREAEEVLAEETLQRYEACVEREQDQVVVLSLDRLKAERPYFYHSILKEAMCRVAGQEKDLGYAHLEEVEKMLSVGGHAKVDLHYGVVAEKDAGFLFFYPGKLDIRDLMQGLYCEAKDLPDYPFGEEEPTVEQQIIPLQRGSDYTLYTGRDRYTQNFDYDKIKTAFCWRHRQTGDHLVADEEGHIRSLKEYFIDEKVPESLRDRMWVLAAGQEILWIPGFRISESVKITKETQRVLQIKVLVRKD